MQVGIDPSRIFLINEKGQITQKNKHFQSSYSNLNELIDLIFPYVRGNNTNFSKYGFFKPRMIVASDVKKLFE
jgi:phosphatidate phosphatase PAH1